MNGIGLPSNWLNYKCWLLGQVNNGRGCPTISWWWWPFSPSHHTTLTLTLKPSQYVWMLCLDRFLSFSSKTSQRWLRHGQFDANNSMRRLFQRHSVFALLALMSLCSVSNAAFCPSASRIWRKDDGPLRWLDKLKLYLSLHIANSFSISNRFWPRFICNLNYSRRFPKIIRTYSLKERKIMTIVWGLPCLEFNWISNRATTRTLSPESLMLFGQEFRFKLVLFNFP